MSVHLLVPRRIYLYYWVLEGIDDVSEKHINDLAATIAIQTAAIIPEAIPPRKEIPSLKDWRKDKRPLVSWQELEANRRQSA